MSQELNKPKIIDLSSNSLTVLLGKETFVFDFEAYPYFKHCTLDEIYNIESDGFGLSWPFADLDFELNLLRNPREDIHKMSVQGWLKIREMLIMKRALKEHAKRAGKVKSEAKTVASKANGTKGGRPRLNALSKIAML